MATPDLLAPIADVRLWVLGSASDASQDAILELLRTNIVGQFQDYTHRQICKRVDFLEKLNGKNLPWLVPFDAPIISVSKLEIVDPTGPTVLQTLVEGEDFVIDENKEQLLLRHITDRRAVAARFLPRFVAGEGNIQITYTSGYDPIPGGIKQAYLDTIKMHFDLRKTTSGLKSEKLGDYAYTKDDGGSKASGNSGNQLSGSARSALNSYIRPWVGTLGREMTPDSLTRRAGSFLP